MKNKNLTQRITENWKVKILCILGAIVIYITFQVVSLEKKIIPVPLKIKNTSNLLYTNEIPRWVRVVVRGSSNDVALLQDKDFDVFIDLSEYAEPGKYKVPLHIQLSENATMINDLEVQVNPNLIELNLEQKVTALVPIKTNISGSCANGYEISSLEIYPDLVQITGSSSLIENTAFLETSVINVEGKSSDFSQKVNILNQNSRISLTGEKVFTVTVKIKPINDTKQIESSVIFYHSLKDDLSIENPNIPYKITLSGTKNDLDKFVLTPLSVQVDCSEIQTSGTYKIPLSVILPKNIIMDKIEPSQVDVKVVDFLDITLPQNSKVESETTNEEEVESENDIESKIVNETEFKTENEESVNE